MYANHVAFAISIIVSVFLIPLTLKKSKEYWAIKDTPTVTPGGAIIGNCEISGLATMKVEEDSSQAHLLTSPISESDCVWYSLAVYKFLGIGNRGDWKKCYFEQIDAFAVGDRFAKINVYTDNAAVNCSSLGESQSDEHSLNKLAEYFSSRKGDPEIDEILEGIATENICLIENLVKENEEVFAHGNIVFREDSSQLEMGKDKHEKTFISTKGERSVRLDRLFVRLGIHFVTLVSMFTVLSTGWEIFAKDVSILRRSLFFYILIAFYFLFFNYFRSYNRLVKLLQTINSADSTIGVVQKRRKHLIPQLIDAVANAKLQEFDTQTLITQIRNTELDTTKSVSLLLEQYPSIKSISNFVHLQNELARTEEKIAMARSFRNDAVLNYNNFRPTFSGMVLKPVFKQISA